MPSGGRGVLLSAQGQNREHREPGPLNCRDAPNLARRHPVPHHDRAVLREGDHADRAFRKPHALARDFTYQGGAMTASSAEVLTVPQYRLAGRMSQIKLSAVREILKVTERPDI